MFKKKANPEHDKREDKFATTENPAIIFQPLSNMKIIIGNVEDKDDEYKTEPFPPHKQ